jgi:hypothetical protein
LITAAELHSQVILDSAYAHKSSDQLKEIFDRWADQSKPVSENELKLKRNHEKYAYEIFEDFYTPKSISRVGHSEFGDSVYNDIEYAFVQNEVIIEIYNKLILDNYSSLDYSKPLSEYKLVDFRPRVKVPNSKIIYLDEFTKSSINDFLKSNFTPMGENNLMDPAAAEGESQERLEFINQYARIYPGHWGNFWKIETCPTVSIRFNKTFTKAAVDFRLFYQGGSALYLRKNNKWKFKKSSLIWIE